jgi:hypothetical protein
LSFMLSFALVFGHLRLVFGSPIPLFIHLPISITKLAWMTTSLHSFQSCYFLEAKPCTFFHAQYLLTMC